MTFASTKTSSRPACYSLEAYALLPFILRPTACKIALTIERHLACQKKITSCSESHILTKLVYPFTQCARIIPKSTIQRQKPS